MQDEPRRHAGDSVPESNLPLAHAAIERRRRKDVAAILPFAGIVLFATPLLDLVVSARSALGLPVGLIYIFSAWFSLIALTAWLARRLIHDGLP